MWKKAEIHVSYFRSGSIQLKYPLVKLPIRLEPVENSSVWTGYPLTSRTPAVWHVGCVEALAPWVFTRKHAFALNSSLLIIRRRELSIYKQKVASVSRVAQAMKGPRQHI